MTGITKGVFLHSYNLPMGCALEKAIQGGFKYIQLWNIGGEHAPKNLPTHRIEPLKDLLYAAGAQISALCGHLPLCDPARVSVNIAKLNSVIDLAEQLDVSIVTTETGILPKGVDFDTAWRTLIDVLDVVCSYAALKGRIVAIEAGSKTLVNSPQLLLKMIEETNSSQLRINIDPANLYKAGHDPVAAVYTLRDYIVHAHAKDAKLVNGEFMEPRLGDGDVPVRDFIKALHDIGFQGTIAIERESGTEREADIMHASRLIDEYLAEL